MTSLFSGLATAITIRACVPLAIVAGWIAHPITNSVSGRDLTPDWSTTIDHLRADDGKVTSNMCVLVARDGDIALVASSDGKLRSWDIEKRRVKSEGANNLKLPLVMWQHKTGVFVMSCLPGPVAYTMKGTELDKCCLYLSRTGVAPTCKELRGHTGSFLSGQYCPNEDIFVSVASRSNESEIGVWRLQEDPIKVKIFKVEIAEQISITPDGKYAVFGGASGQVRTIAINSGEVSTWQSMERGAIAKVSVAPDGKSVLIGYKDGTLSEWALSGGSGRLIRQYEKLGFEITAINWSRDGKLLAACGCDIDYETLRPKEPSVLKVWKRGEEASLRSVRHHNDRVNSLAFSADSRKLISVDWNGGIGCVVIPKMNDEQVP